MPATPQRELTLSQTTALIIGTVIGSGVFLSLPIVARIAGSPGMNILIWLLGGVVWIPQILVLAELSTAYPTQGATYYYLQKAGSPFLAFLYTWTAFLTSDTPTLTIVALAAITALKVFSPLFTDPVITRILAALLIASLALLHVRSVRTGGNVQILLTLAKLTPLVSIVILGMLSLDQGDLRFEASGSSVQEGGLLAVINAGIAATVWSYAGFTNILYMGGEVRNPHRTLPVALIGSLLFVMVAYVLIAAGTHGLVPFGDLTAVQDTFVNPFLFVEGLASSAGTLFAIAVFVNMIGVLSASIMVQPRLEYAIARDGLFFDIFGRLHPKYLTPHYSILIQAGLAVVLFLLGNLENMLGYFTISYLLQNALVYGTIFFLRKQEGYSPTYRAPLWQVMAVLAIAAQLWIGGWTFWAYPAGGILACLGLIASGFPVYRYFYTKRGRGSAGTGPASGEGSRI
jgi:fructoselysine transporter